MSTGDRWPIGQHCKSMGDPVRDPWVSTVNPRVADGRLMADAWQTHGPALETMGAPWERAAQLIHGKIHSRPMGQHYELIGDSWQTHAKPMGLYHRPMGDPRASTINHGRLMNRHNELRATHGGSPAR